jgi:type I restriction enzyme R subunit
VFESWRFDTPPLSMNGGFERARSVFGGEAEIERVLADINRTVFDSSSSGAPEGEPAAPGKPLN